MAIPSSKHVPPTPTAGVAWKRAWKWLCLDQNWDIRWSGARMPMSGFHMKQTNAIISQRVFGSRWLWMDCESEKPASVSISQYQLILWYFTPNSFQLSSAIEGDVTDSINNIFLTLSSPLCLLMCTWATTLKTVSLLSLFNCVKAVLLFWSQIGGFVSFPLVVPDKIPDEQICVC